MSEKKTEYSSEMEKLQEAINNKDIDGALKVLKDYRDKKNLKSDVRNYRCVYKDSGDTDDTILHLAAAYLDERHNAIIEEIVKLSPDLLAAGKSSKSHSGQTPFHILIVRKQNDTLRRIKDLYLSGELEMGDTVKNNISNPNVEGDLFKKTIMEGELPHIVAALTLDIETANLVIQMTSANIKSQNSKGNTVYHCLVEHAARYPEEIQGVTAMWNFLTSYVPTTQTAGYQDRIQAAIGSKDALRLTNKKLMRPLQLAAGHGVATLFNIILESEKIQNVKDRLFDSYLYDISVIDTVAHFTVQTKQKEQNERNKRSEEPNLTEKQNKVSPSETLPSSNGEGTNDEQVGKEVKTEKFKYSRSVLEMMCNSRLAKDKTAVSEMLRQPAMKKLIDRKWDQRRCCVRFYIWAIYHFLIMVWYSTYAVNWAAVAFPTNSTHPETLNAQTKFVKVSSYILFILVGVPYSFVTVLLMIARFIRPNRLDYIHHDLEFIILLLLFSIGVLVNFIWYYIYLKHGVSFLLMALLSGWWFCIFFFRPFKAVSFYVVMIQKVVFGDLLRFGLFILLALVSFSIVIQILFQGEGVQTAYGDDRNGPWLYSVFIETILFNTRLMFGFGDVDFFYNSREPFLSNIVYHVYLIMTYLVLLNSLIAMISETCTSVRDNETVYYHTQRLFVILFLEDITYPFWLLHKKMIPSVSFEERPVLRNGIKSQSYFLKMTDENPANDNSDDIPIKNCQELHPRSEVVNITIQQPFLEESFKDGLITHELKWNDRH